MASATSATNAQGLAQIVRTLGSTPGTYTTTADGGRPHRPTGRRSRAPPSPGRQQGSVRRHAAWHTARSGRPASHARWSQVQDARRQSGAGRATVVARRDGQRRYSRAAVCDHERERRGDGHVHRARAPRDATPSGLTVNGTAITDNATVTRGGGAGERRAVDRRRRRRLRFRSAVRPATITVTARDGSGNPIAGATVVLSATGEWQCPRSAFGCHRHERTGHRDLLLHRDRARTR